MNGLQRVIRDEPVIITDAVRLTLLAIVLIGLNLSDEAVIAITAAVGAILTVASRALVTPNQKFDTAVNREAENIAEAIVTDQAAPLTDEERATLDELRTERNGLRDEITAVNLRRDLAAKRRTP